MSVDARLPHDAPAREAAVPKATGSRWSERFARLGDQAEVARRDAMRSARDRTAVALSTGRAQVERAQSFVSFNARRRPLVVTGLAAAVGVLVGVALRAGAGARSR